MPWQVNTNPNGAVTVTTDPPGITLVLLSVNVIGLLVTDACESVTLNSAIAKDRNWYPDTPSFK